MSDSALLATLQAAGVDASRDDIVIDPPTNYGAPPTSGYANDPVNTATGNFLENETDLGFPGAASTLALTRTYNSFDTSTGAFGPGWSSWTEAGLAMDDEAARMRLPDGRVIVFPRLGTGWDRATGANLWLEADGPADPAPATTTAPGGSSTTAVALVEHATRPGAAVRLVHDDDRLRPPGPRARPRRRPHAGTRPATRVTGATASDGRHLDYAYDDSGRLTSVTGPAGTRSYAWDDAGLISSVTDADGVVEAENAYDEHGRVTHQRSAFGRRTRFAYLPGNVTVVSDEDGTRSNTWLHDSKRPARSASSTPTSSASPPATTPTATSSSSPSATTPPPSTSTTTAAAVPAP